MDSEKLQREAQQRKSLAQGQLEALRRDRFLSDQGRQARMAVIVRRVSGELEQLRAQAMAETARERTELERACGATPVRAISVRGEMRWRGPPPSRTGTKPGLLRPGPALG